MLFAGALIITCTLITWSFCMCGSFFSFLFCSPPFFFFFFLFFFYFRMLLIVFVSFLFVFSLSFSYFCCS